ncbi:antitoxin Xre/MbcA/ParS toxin-binding domain-containing protein [Alcanivoracaceae bacterium MT1]|uniref:antitoxin Xre/MbcA/ParS toxin-binding domain-containing protein n=1 Tax=Alloalcanivorax xenomutans TaxID=1094342 RepID=UPI003A3F260C
MPYTVYIKLAENAGLEQKELYRFAEVLKAATDLFEGDKVRARQWLLNPVRGLGGRRPVEMIATSAEAEAVLNLIGRLEHGITV